MPDVFEVVAACAVPPGDPAAAARIRAALPQLADWPDMLAVAAEHGMVPLVCRRVLDTARDLLDGDGRDGLAAAARAAAARALAAANQLAEVIGTLDAAGVAAMPYKGPALAIDAFGDAGLRESNDLDIVVASGAAAAAADAIARVGYLPVGAQAWAAARANNDWQGQVPFSAHGRPFPVELHWRFCDRKLPWNPSIDAVIGRSATTVTGGVPMRVPERHDQVILVLLHAARHGWDRLEPMACAAALMHRGLDGATFMRRAEAVGGRRACLVGLELTRRVLGVHPPDAVSRAMAAEPELGALADRAELRLRAGDAGEVRDAGLHLASLDDFTARVRYVALHAALPTAQDRAVVRLPRALNPLYTIVRVGRLTLRAISG